MTPKLLAELGRLIEKKGTLHLSHSDGSGMGLYWGATLGHNWPWCHSSTIDGALKDLVSEHLRIEREELQKRINEIDASSGL